MNSPTPSVVHTRVRHVRREPVDHRFEYASLSWLIDVDEIPTLPLGLRWTAKFRPADHFPQCVRPGETLRGRLDRYLDDAGIGRPDGRVVALLSPRTAGYVFNPLSVFWCHDAAGALSYVVAEVHNTYGERHCYVVRTDAAGRAHIGKSFYVSPFNDVAGQYRLVLPEPDSAGEVRLAIVLERTGNAPFTATVTGTAHRATVAEVIRAQVRAPLSPLLVAARIRFHGIRLWARGLRIQPRPDQTARPDREEDLLR
ncbi:DUF1365 domain-containing protein [Gordonia sp. (in: high G+C Gram-positive bacteria)]|uniref:DUF1365 domain-containing protein n=1 Tax=Gordonia sp. (in: high G+C Gram-positive bacteria) TaxID=84139 RepID=UPI003528CC5D